MTPSVHIAGVGARTPVGLAAPAAAAAVRAGISRLGEHPFLVDQVGDLMPAAMDPLLDPALFGFQRFLSLATTALQEACVPLADFRVKAPLYLALPERRPGFSIEDANAIRSGIASLASAFVSEVNVIAEGHAAGFAALQQAAGRIQRGEVEVSIAGGVDSYFHPDTMEWLDANRQLVGAVSRSGFVPGEGAGFCLLMSESAGMRFGVRQLAHIFAVATGRETKLIKTSDVCLGEGLTETVREATRGLELPAERITDILCDMNSERYRTEEWGFVCLRLPLHCENPTGYVSPADCWGDMGAASGPLFVMVACEAGARGYSGGPRTLLWASSEGGLRGAAVLQFGRGREAGYVM